MADFPTLSQGESPSLYKNTPDPVVSKAKTDGGYELRRRRFTRAARRKIETGFLFISDVDFKALDSFHDVHLRDVAFNWHDYQFGVTRIVRFDDYKPEYKGVGQNQMWHVKIKMSEV